MQLPKPPKLFSMKKSAEAEIDTTSVPEPTEEAPRVWSPPPEPTMTEPSAPEPENIPETPAEEEDLSRYAPPPVTETAPLPEPEEVIERPPVEEEFVPEPEDNQPVAPESEEEEPILSPMDENEVIEEDAEETIPESDEDQVGEEMVAEPEEVIEETVSEPEQEEMVSEPEEVVEEVYSRPKAEPVKKEIEEEENTERYARPKAQSEVPVEDEVKYTPQAEPAFTAASVADLSEPMQLEDNERAIHKLLGKDQNIVRAKSVSSIPFSDIWYTAEKVAYIRDESTQFALVPFLSDDLSDFYKALEQGYTGQSSYAIRFAGESYRVERVITLSGAQYNCRKMPTSVPDIFSLGLPKHIVEYLLTLSREAGLILFGGPTGMGKTTSASALMKKFLEENGGFMYTIEDPPEMPLDGLYRAQNGGLGLCKQCPVDNERWGDGIKSALRSRPRYILVGEIRTPETASQVLRAATSGHLVLSTIHASTVEDSLESIIKYASGAGLTESLAADLLARGILAVVHQKLEGSEKLRPVISAAFANPHLTGGDQMRSLIRNNTINLQTLIEAQSSRLFQGRPLFEDK